MPFAIRKSGNSFQVVNSDTGDVKGEHDSEDKAKKQLAALNANYDPKKQWDNDIHVKSIEATIEDTTTDEDGPGEFTVALATPDLDRDGDELTPEGWELPLPEHITFVNDHTHRVASVVGSARPTLEGAQVICRGTYATTQNGQDTRQLVKGGHVTNVSVAYREKRDGKRELINGSFVVVPANPMAKVLSSKSLEDKDVMNRFLDMFSQMKEFIDDVLTKAGKTSEGGPEKPYGNVTYADPGYQEDGKKRYPLDTEAHVRNAAARIAQNTDRYSSEELSHIKGKIRSAAKKFGIELSEKKDGLDEIYTGPMDDCTLGIKDLAPEGTGSAADQSADQDEVKTLALLKAKALTLNCTHQFD